MSSSAIEEDRCNGDSPQDNPLGGGVSKEQSFSSEGIVRSGAPQGSVHGPLLSLIFIYDLENELIYNHLFFEDDVKLIASRRLQPELRSSIQQVLS